MVYNDKGGTMSEINPETQEVLNALPLPPVHIALVIDNEVVDIIHANDRLGAIFLSNPTIIDVSETLDSVKVGYIYNPATSQFSEPS
jgi:hypothetical protein